MNYFITIEQDECSENPRDEFDHLGTLYTWHPRYTIGGKDDENCKPPVTDINVWIYDNFNEVAQLPELERYNSYDGEIAFLDEDETQDTFEITTEQHTYFDSIVNQWKEQNLCILPVYMYDHSGITLSTGPFSCPWDSGRVGFIYVTKETCKQQGVTFNNAESILKNEIKELDAYLTGDVYSYTIWETEEDCDPTEIYEHLDNFEKVDNYAGCGGFYGYNYCKENALEHLAAIQKANKKGQLELFTPEMSPAI